MDRTRISVCIVLALVLLSGCLFWGSEPEPQPEFTTAVDADSTAFIDAEYPVTVIVENVGDGDGEYTTNLTLDGEVVAEETVSVEAGHETSVELTHVFETEGTYTVEIENETVDVTVESTPYEAARDHSERTTSYIASETYVTNAVVEDNGREFDVTNTERRAAQYNLTTEEMYADIEVEQSAMGISQTMHAEEWFVDGTLYEKAESDEGGSDFAYTARAAEWADIHAGEPSDVVDIIDESTVEHNGSESIYTADSTTVDDISHLLNILGNADEIENPEDMISNMAVEVVVEGGEISRVTVELSIPDLDDMEVQGWDVQEMDLTITHEYEAYNQSVTVSVPDDVHTNTAD